MALLTHESVLHQRGSSGVSQGERAADLLGVGTEEGAVHIASYGLAGGSLREILGVAGTDTPRSDSGMSKVPLLLNGALPLT